MALNNFDQYAKSFVANLARQGVQFQGLKVLDIGIGPNAFMAREIKRRGGEVYAIDKDPQAVLSVLSSGDVPRDHIKVASAGSLANGNPFNQRFDLVICSGAMEYMHQPERAAMIHGIHRHCLAPGGSCAVVVDQYTEEQGYSYDQFRQKLRAGRESEKIRLEQRKWTGAALSNYFSDVRAINVEGVETAPLLFVAHAPKPSELVPASPHESAMQPAALTEAARGYRLTLLPGIPIYENAGPGTRGK